MEASTQILLVMLVYAFFLFLYGLWQGRKVKNSQDFAIAGRSLSGVVASLSERATGESSWALLGLPGAAYATGLLEVWTAIGCVIGIIFSWIVLAWRIQKDAAELDATTFTDFIAKKHGDKGRLIRIAGMVGATAFRVAVNQITDANELKDKISEFWGCVAEI